MKKALLIVNPSSGGEKAVEYKDMAIVELEKNFDELIVKYTEKKYDATEFAKEACKEKYHSIFGMGGDGTVNEIINGIAEQEYKPKFGFFPLGTVNDLARVLEIPLNPKEAIENFDINSSRKIDIGKVNNKYFMNVIAIGSIPHALNSVEVEDKTTFGKFAYYIAGIKEVVNMKFYDFKIELGGEVKEIKSSLILIGLTRSIGGYEQLFPKAKVDDNRLHIMYIKDENIIDTLFAVPNLIFGLKESSDSIEYLTCEAIKVDLISSEKLSINVDGDDGDNLPIEISVLPSHIEVYV